MDLGDASRNPTPDVDEHDAPADKEYHDVIDCPHCDAKFKFTDAHAWRDHILEHKRKPETIIIRNRPILLCDLLNCSYTTTNPSHLKSHMERHKVNRKRLPCPVEGCTYTAFRKCEVTRHQKKHKNPHYVWEGQGSYPCEIKGCPFWTFSRAVFEEHMVEHETLQRATTSTAENLDADARSPSDASSPSEASSTPAVEHPEDTNANKDPMDGVDDFTPSFRRSWPFTPIANTTNTAGPISSLGIAAARAASTLTSLPFTDQAISWSEAEIADFLCLPIGAQEDGTQATTPDVDMSDEQPEQRTIPDPRLVKLAEAHKAFEAELARLKGIGSAQASGVVQVEHVIGSAMNLDNALGLVFDSITAGNAFNGASGMCVPGAADESQAFFEENREIWNQLFPDTPL
ncbi:hypothetical protein CC1G_05045 [Coprinopsis cinerea okayama7|uniref:C2H2-type domain-containing protein n=1 Tax=Coprinopsis cinerea (strain Okayama-7 / 130 / ATCC MYA-4618 / FGSC 9003) TaxID=240176 RepID=A8NSN6_COPC7|nr:hypothetical protein CC1G_05045 [Coprinopsis cinerea okayama7\|eukprot:XP_001836052.2 hypothetical protein CC1G_05045 [Coprinopsis cinerea okayama7\